MNLVRFFKPVLFIFIGLNIVHCSDSSDGGTEDELFGKVNAGICPHSPYDGPGPQTTGKSFNVNESGYFEKKIITGKLDSLLTSSGINIAQYIVHQGVQLYQVDEESKSQCQYFAFLKLPTDKALKNWEGNSSPSGNGTLLGLFTTYYVSQGGDQFTLREPTIMVRQDTQKWTLLHEFSHYLFAESRVRSPMKDNDTLTTNLKEAGTVLDQKISQFNNDKTLSNARELIDNINQFFSLSHELNQRGPLEEFSIESMLVDRLKNGELTLVDERQDVFNAVNYMRSNTSRVVPLYKELLDFLEKYNQTYFQDQWPSVSTESKVIENKIANNLDFISQKITEAQDIRDFGVQPALFSMSMSLHALSQEPELEINHHHYDIKIVELQEELYEMFH